MKVGRVHLLWCCGHSGRVGDGMAYCLGGYESLHLAIAFLLVDGL